MSAAVGGIQPFRAAGARPASGREDGRPVSQQTVAKKTSRDARRRRGRPVVDHHSSNHALILRLIGGCTFSSISIDKVGCRAPVSTSTGADGPVYAISQVDLSCSSAPRCTSQFRARFSTMALTASGCGHFTWRGPRDPSGRDFVARVRSGIRFRIISSG